MTAIEALIIILSSPDPPDLARRGFRYTQPGDWLRRNEIKRDLGTAYVERMRQEWTDGDISRVISVRRLRMVKHA